MVRLFKNEDGNAAAPLLILVGGVSLFLAQNEMKSLNTRVDQVREESRKNFMGQQNVSALQLAARLMVGDDGTQPAPVRVDPYIPQGLCDQGRQLTAANGGNWQSTGQTITIQSLTQNFLQKSGDSIFAQLSQGQQPNVAPDASTQLKVLGWKCDDLHPFLLEGVYVEAETAGEGNKQAKTKALLAMAPPPPSTCLFYAKDATDNPYPSNKKPVGNPEISVPVTTAELFLECNHVVTDAEIFKDGAKIGDTNSYPLTAANRIDDTQKVLLGPIALTSGGTLKAVVEQVDGSKLSLDMKLSLASPPATTGPDASCAKKCIHQEIPNYPNLCDNKLVHMDHYASVSPQHYVCYQCEEFIGFDPETCKKVGVVGNRTPDYGCFAGDTQIRLDDGRDVAIQDLKAGDRIWNPILKRAVPITKVVRGPERKPLYQVSQGDRTVRVTYSHPFVTPFGLIPVSQLRAGDLIQSQDGRWVSVDAVVKEKEVSQDDVWNLELAVDEFTEAAHMVVANGILTGDLYLQQRVQSRALQETFSLANMSGISP